LNELATNAMKHGYVNEPNPAFAVSMEEAEETGE
jgi:two-component sensor histidine kinase